MVHAMAAFEADPVQGSALLLMLRLADQVDATEVIETLTRVAQKASRSEERACWVDVRGQGGGGTSRA